LKINVHIHQPYQEIELTKLVSRRMWRISIVPFY